MLTNNTLLYIYTLDKLILSTHVGIHDHERINPQELIFSLKAELSHALPKNLSIEIIIQEYCQKHKPLLLEKMAYDLAYYILNQIFYIKSLSLTIQKPQALKQAACSYVTIDMFCS